MSYSLRAPEMRVDAGHSTPEIGEKTRGGKETRKERGRGRGEGGTHNNVNNDQNNDYYNVISKQNSSRFEQLQRVETGLTYQLKR